ncbi:MAG: Flp pilus assembly complex ATPase component TadA, partial [Oscillospiraceae bacterium]|nr:Flp pilus assembly complex ATPase component TadA [Oscillospiraceae bacterium]
MRNTPIGEYLIQKKLITAEQLNAVLDAQREAQGQKRFGDVIIDSGFLTEVDFIKALAEKLRVPYVDLDLTTIDPEAVLKIPETLAKKHMVMAYSIQGRRLTIATDDPINFNILEDIKVFTGMDTIPVLATKTGIKKAIGRHYSMQNVDSVLEGVNQLHEEEEDDASRERVESAPIVKLATTIVENAFRAEATDVHIEPFSTYTKIRIRVNGDLLELMTISNVVHSALSTRIKLISGMNIAERRVPQDGRYTQIVDGITLDMRVSSLPMVNGEKIVIRILSTGQIALRKLTDLGMSEYNYKMYSSMIKCPHGVILVTGPTGSGKTTTLYATLAEIAKPHVNVITIEDPVEKNIDGVNQVQVNNKAGMTFSAGLRSVLRQDPDIVMVGEMRDSETAEIGIRAAITGHLVLSTLHTNDAASSIIRLVDMGIPAYLVASSLVGAIAQRLVKVLCPKCKVKRMSKPEENLLMGIHESVEVYDAVGCPECSNTG